MSSGFSISRSVSSNPATFNSASARDSVRRGDPAAPIQPEARFERKCEACEDYTKDAWFCNICKSTFCEQCWAAQFVHKKVRSGLRHEQTRPEIAEKVHNVLSPPTDDVLREQLYREDELTSWFGIARAEDNAPPLFQDYGRFADLMSSTDPVRSRPDFMEWAEVGRDTRTPSLVSFVGQTGAGKSALVKLLIDFALKDPGDYQTPVVGSRGAHLPTSEDVHLYLDPKTSSSPGPLLYADCEGLEGGEREPLSAMFRRKRRSHGNGLDAETKVLKSCKVISERELEWADVSRTRSREFAVTNLYPRLLYTFSDVVVFVLRNPRTIEQVFEKFVRWAAAAIETSSNQPVLPHAIIALNASDDGIAEKFWDVRHNTNTILEDLAQTVNRNETFKRWAQFWRERGKVIETLEQLVLCYYSSIQIVRLPGDGRPKLMAEQIEKLYKATLSACVAARGARNEVRMLLDVEDMQAYLQEAFNHYSKTLESPFDFVQASFRNSPIPPDFGGNILKLALSVMGIWQNDNNFNATKIFNDVSFMVASCIMLESARQNNKGFAHQIFPKYMNHLDDALENFCDQHWPCEFVKPRTNIRCVNVRSGHTSKGHQSADGRVFAAGDYVSNISFDRHGAKFRDKVFSILVQLLQELTSRRTDRQPEDRVAAEIHKSMVLNHFFRRTTRRDWHSMAYNSLTSHTACFCCLFGQAEHYLPCGHTLCTTCLRTYGEPHGPHSIKITGCPIEEPEANRDDVWIIYLKPRSAGIRVLTLDGGGIRGIVELETLAHIEKALDGVPIQLFFDLIVGTSTGGLVALGLGALEWPVDECIRQFETLCGEAFTRRSGSGLPVIGPFIDNYYHSRYQTSTLENALKFAFSEDTLLFGGRRSAGHAPRLKVAVTATSLSGNKTYVLTNYNHPRTSQKPHHYHFQRPELSDAELKIWEVARATTAAPRYFKSFHHEASHKTYIDGAVLHNNPIRIADSERKILWPGENSPDLLLSLGTGTSPSLSRASSTSEYATAARNGVFNHGRQLYSIARNNIDHVLDCERAWDDFFATVTTALSSSRASTSKFIRINPSVGIIPALDEKHKMADLRGWTRQALHDDHPRIQDVARQLIASSYYFEVISASHPDDCGRITIQGKIQCRLPQPSPQMSKLATHLRNRAARQAETPMFSIYEDGGNGPLRNIVLTDAELETIVQKGVFDPRRISFRIKNKVLPIHIVMLFGKVAMHPISGFPRSFSAHEERADPAAPTFLSTTSSSRYTHGSRRTRRLAGSWEPPDLERARSLTNLRQYADRRRTVVDDVEGETTVEALAPQLPPATSIPTESTEFCVSPVSASRRNPVREAFRALLSPFRPNKGDRSESLPVEELEPELQQWLRGYRHAEAQILGTPADSAIPDEQLAFSLQYYNVKPEEYALYRQWINLLQPSEGRDRSPWLPPTDRLSAVFARSAAGCSEVNGDTVFAVELPVPSYHQAESSESEPLAAQNPPESPSTSNFPAELP